MNKMLKVLLTVMLGAVLLIAGCSGESNQISLGRITGCAGYSGQSPQIGELAPDFQFQTPEGQSTSLSEFRGTPVLVNFWAYWCNPCTFEMPFLQQVYDEWQEKGLVLLAIHIGEGTNEAASFVENYSITFPVLLDINTEVALCYYIEYIPTTFFIDEDGIVQDIKVGAFSSVEEIEAGLSQLLSQ